MTISPPDKASWHNPQGNAIYGSCVCVISLDSSNYLSSLWCTMEMWEQGASPTNVNLILLDYKYICAPGLS